MFKTQLQRYLLKSIVVSLDGIFVFTKQSIQK